MAAGGAHAQRVPVAVDGHALGVRRDHRVAVALHALLGDEAHGRVEHGGRGRAGAEQLAAVDAPPAVRAGGDRAGAGEVLARLGHGGAHAHAVDRDPPQRLRQLDRAGAVHPHHVQQRGHVHVDPDRDGRVAAGEPAGGDHDVVEALRAETAQLDRDGRGVVARVGQPLRALERERALAVVVARARGQLGHERLGERDQARAGRRPCGQGQAHGVTASISTGTPLATMSKTAERFWAFVDDRLQDLVGRVALDGEGGLDLREAVAVAVVDAEAAAHVHLALEGRLDLGQAHLAGGGAVDEGRRQAGGERVQEVLGRVRAGVGAEQDGGLARVEQELLGAGGVLAAGAVEALDRRAVVGAVDPAVAWRGTRRPRARRRP